MANNKTWKVPVTWEMCGVVEVLAENAKDALDAFEAMQDEIPLPKDGNYVDASFRYSYDDEEGIEMENAQKEG